MPSLSFIYPSALWLLLLLLPLWGLALAVPRRLGAVRFWGSLGLRSLLLLALILSLAGTQYVASVSELSTVFLLDSSDSVAPSLRGRAETFIQAALGTMGTNDRAAIVSFGANALVERAPSSDRALGRITSIPTGERTDIEHAIQLGLALLPADTQKRMVLLSDGAENSGQALAAARLAAARGIPLDIVSLGATTSEPELLVAQLDAPSQVREGQEVALTAHIVSTVAQEAHIRVFADRTLLREDTLQLPVGETAYTTRVPATTQGFDRYRVVVEPQSDGRAQNNEAAALIEVLGPPRVLLVAANADDARPLESALSAASLRPEIIAPGLLPTDLATLSSYDAIVLVNTPARDLPVKALAALPAYVRDLGRGLMMLGGTESYGVGGYGRTPVEEALPVYTDVRDRQERPDLALVFVIDKSGSMDACHCSSSNRSTAQLQQGGERKVDIAKESMIQAAVLLRPQDTLGIVTFDEGAHWTLPATHGATANQVVDAVSNIEPIGGTNLRAGLDSARDMLQKVDARIKHIILLTDGWGSGGANLDVARELRAQGVTLSVVAAGGGSADYLEQLAITGGGRYYAVQDINDVPQIFLQETITAVGNYIIEHPVAPARMGDSPIVAGMEALPQLRGYNGTTIKETARLVLADTDGAPLLATWQYGLGRSVAWTSDMTGHWAPDWVNWPTFPRFVAQAVGWMLPTRSADAVTTQVQVAGATTTVEVQVAPDSVGGAADQLQLHATIIANDSSTQSLALHQVAPGRYRGSLNTPIAGTYLVQIAGAQGAQVVVQTVAGLVVPYSAEYRMDSGNPVLLDGLRSATNGRLLTLDSAGAAQVFAPTNQPVRRAQELALPLLLLALIVLPLDIAFRRVLLRWGEVTAGLAELRARMRQGRTPVAAPNDQLERLAQARRRTIRTPRAAVGAAAAPPTATQRPTDTPPPPPPPLPPAVPAAPPTSEVDPFERLREAKERARRRARGEE